MRKIVLFSMLLLLCGSLVRGQERGEIIWASPENDLAFDYSVWGARQAVAERVGPLGIPAWLANLLVNVKYPLKGYKVKYWTLNVNPDDPGNQTEPLVEAMGLVIVPQQTGCKLPLALYCHGTIFGENNVPSNPELFKEDFIASLAYAGYGYLTVVPNYVGYGDDGTVPHPYLDARTEAAASIDLMRAARELAGNRGYDLSGEVFIAGHSQGGHAGAATLRSIAQDFPFEFDVKFAGLSSGAYDLSDVQFDFVFNDPAYPGEELTLLVLAGCQVSSCTTPALDFCNTADVLVNEYIDDPYGSYILGQWEGAREAIDGPWGKYFLDSYLAGIGNSDLRNICLERNNVYNWLNLKKTTFYYCQPDERVSYENSVKARNVQRSNIPWYWFWLRWQINTFNSGNFDHITCALPSLYFARCAFEQNRQYCPSQKSLARPLPQETADHFVSPFLFFDTEVDLRNFPAPVVRVEMLDLNDQVVRVWSKEELQGSLLTIERGDLTTGLYGLVFYLNDREPMYAGISVLDPEPAVSDLYDPIWPNPMQHQATLDLSLLEETVSKISIYDLNGRLLRRMAPEAKAREVKLERNNLPAGDYLVEVRTDRQSYFLPLNLVPVPSPGALVAPNPMQEKTWVDLSAIQGIVRVIRLYTPEGRLLRTYTDISEVAEWFEIDRGNLPAGLYLLELDATTGKKVVKLVVD